MKGNKMAPQCGFSGQVVQILNHIGCQYETKMFYKTKNYVKVLKNFQIGQQFHNYM